MWHITMAYHYKQIINLIIRKEQEGVLTLINTFPNMEEVISNAPANQGIKDNFGLLSIHNWWALTFRTANGIGAMLFIRLLKTPNWRTMGTLALRTWIKNAVNWSTVPAQATCVNTQTCAGDGLGPWVPEDT